MKRIDIYKSIALISLAVFMSSFLSSCKSGKMAKSETNVKDMAVLDSLYGLDNYYVGIDVAYPFTTVATARVTNQLMRNTGNSANRIDVSGDGNYIKIKNDSIVGYLPFFGERRLNAGAYGSADTSIQFDEPLENLTKQINTKKGKLKLEFIANQKGNDNDRYEIVLEIFPNNKVSVILTPVNRTFMRYGGVLENQKDE